MTDAASDATDLSALAARAEAGEVTHVDLIDAFLSATVFVPSVTDPEDGRIDPVVSKIDEVEYLIVAATAESLEQTGDVARFAVPMAGRALVNGMNPDLALMVNLDAGAFAMPKAMLDDIREQSAPLM